MTKNIATLLASLTMFACSGTLTSAAPSVEGAPAKSCAGRQVHSDAELASLNGCTEVYGSLRVSGVSSLEPLARLKSVTGTLTVNETKLDDLAGLEALESCSTLMISNNRDLSDLSALRGLESVRQISIHNNPRLPNLIGLSGITEVELLRIHNNGIYSTEGPSNLKKIDRLVITNNSQLISIGALNSVKYVKDLVITQNPRLSAFYGVLDGVSQAPVRAEVSHNRGLEASPKFARPDLIALNP